MSGVLAVILSAAKDLCVRRVRPFAALRVTKRDVLLFEMYWAQGPHLYYNGRGGSEIIVGAGRELGGMETLGQSVWGMLTPFGILQRKPRLE